MNQKPLSNCCSAPMKLHQGDEGTNCFICSKCGKPCDTEKEKCKCEPEGFMGAIATSGCPIHRETKEQPQKEWRKKLNRLGHWDDEGWILPDSDLLRDTFDEIISSTEERVRKEEKEKCICPKVCPVHDTVEIVGEKCTCTRILNPCASCQWGGLKSRLEAEKAPEWEGQIKFITHPDKDGVMGSCPQNCFQCERDEKLKPFIRSILEKSRQEGFSAGHAHSLGVSLEETRAEALEEQRKRIVGEITELAEPYDNAKWHNDLSVKRILNLPSLKDEHED